MSAVHFETDRLAMVPWAADETDVVLDLHSDPDTVRFLGPTGLPWTRTQAAAALEGWRALYDQFGYGKLKLVRKSDSALIGRAGFALFPATGEAELGYLLLPQFRGHGYAREAAAGWSDWFFRARPDDHFIALADVSNAPSHKVLQQIEMLPTYIADGFGLTCQFYRKDRPGHD